MASGDYSTAFGESSNASGDYSTAMGNFATAFGYNSTAMGYASVASGNYSTVMGYFTIASGFNSTTMGFNSKATGIYSTAMGQNTVASGGASTAMGGGSIASGDLSTAMGGNSIASGIASTAMGVNTLSKPYASLVIGQLNDTTAISPSSWNLLDPVFIIGNGIVDGPRSNAMTVLKNGNTGLGTISPQRLLHISGGAGGGIYHNLADMIIEDDDNAYIQFSSPTAKEFGLLSGNAVSSIRSALIFRADSSVFIRSGGNMDRLVINKTGNIGIGTTTPQKKLHVSNGSSGGNPTSVAAVVVEDNASVAINMLTPDGNSSAIYFGNATSAVHGGIVYNSPAPFGLAFRTNGNSTKMVITNAGEVGIGTNTPGALLEVNGNTILGTNGTVLTSVIKVTVTKDVAPVSANSSGTESFSVTNAVTGSTVYVSPASSLSDGLIIGYARVSAAGTVEVKFVNTTAGTINPPSMDFYITVIK